MGATQQFPEFQRINRKRMTFSCTREGRCWQFSGHLSYEYRILETSSYVICISPKIDTVKSPPPQIIQTQSQGNKGTKIAWDYIFTNWKNQNSKWKPRWVIEKESPFLHIWNSGKRFTLLHVTHQWEEMLPPFICWTKFVRKFQLSSRPTGYSVREQRGVNWRILGTATGFLEVELILKVMYGTP